MKRSRLNGALALLLVFSALFLFASCGFSYEKSKIGKYVDLSREDYYGLTVSIPAAKEIGEKDIVVCHTYDRKLDMWSKMLRTE